MSIVVVCHLSVCLSVGFFSLGSVLDEFEVIFDHFGVPKGSFSVPGGLWEALVEQGRPQSAQEPFCELFGSHFGSMLGPFWHRFSVKNQVRN